MIGIWFLVLVTGFAIGRTVGIYCHIKSQRKLVAQFEAMIARHERKGAR